jgi:hypothetical protein
MKIRIRRHVLRPVTKYANDTWTSTESDEFERETLHKIQVKEQLGAVKNCASFTGYWILLEW